MMIKLGIGLPIGLFKKLVALFYLCHGSILCICDIFRQTSRCDTLHSRPKQRKHVLYFSWNPSWKSPGYLFR